jgi:hypothetical protein
MSLAYLGAITVTPTQAAQAVATLDMYASRLASFLPAYSSYRVPPAGVALYGGATMAVDASQQTVGLAPDYMKAAIAAWASMRAFAAERGVSLHAWLPTNFDTIASALPQIRAALSSVRALVRAAVNDNAQAEADRIAVTRGSGYTQAEYGWTPPSATVVTSKVGKAMAMSTPAKVAVGVGVIGLLWLMFGKKRRK